MPKHLMRPCGEIWECAQNSGHSTMCPERERQHCFRRAPIQQREATKMCPECETKHTMPMVPVFLGTTLGAGQLVLSGLW